jgi:hypothetical protein
LKRYAERDREIETEREREGDRRERKGGATYKVDGTGCSS